VFKATKWQEGGEEIQKIKYKIQKTKSKGQRSKRDPELIASGCFMGSHSPLAHSPFTVSLCHLV